DGSGPGHRIAVPLRAFVAERDLGPDRRIREVGNDARRAAPETVGVTSSRRFPAVRMSAGLPTPPRRLDSAWLRNSARRDHTPRSFPAAELVRWVRIMLK